MQIEIVKGDITKVEADVVVNAANPQLQMGGGVAGAIHRAGGKKLNKECRKIRAEKYPNGLPTGEVVITPSGEMENCKYVIHTVGPRYGIDKPEEELLRKSYENSLNLAEKHNLKTIAFPSISTGAYGYPIEKAVKVVRKVLENREFNSLEKAKLVLYSKRDYKIYLKEFKEIINR